MGFYRDEFVLVSKKTGEIVDGMPMILPKKHKLKGGFIMAMQDGFIRLGKEKDLTGQDLKVLLIYMGNLDFENYLQVSQRYIADDLGMAKQHVYRSTKKLVDKGILIEGPKVGKHKTYRLNAFYGWKGKADKKYWEVCEEHFRQVP